MYSRSDLRHLSAQLAVESLEHSPVTDDGTIEDDTKRLIKRAEAIHGFLKQGRKKDNAEERAYREDKRASSPFIGLSGIVEAANTPQPGYDETGVSETPPVDVSDDADFVRVPRASAEALENGTIFNNGFNTAIDVVVEQERIHPGWRRSDDDTIRAHILGLKR